MKRLSAGSAAFAAVGGFVLLYAAVLSFFIRLPSGLLLTALLGRRPAADGRLLYAAEKAEMAARAAVRRVCAAADVYAVSCAVRPARHGVL